VVDIRQTIRRRIALFVTDNVEFPEYSLEVFIGNVRRRRLGWLTIWHGGDR